MDLQKLASQAFNAIEASSGETFAHSTVKESLESFQLILSKHGLAWLIDNTAECGMTHFGFTLWLTEAKKELASTRP